MKRVSRLALTFSLLFAAIGCQVIKPLPTMVPSLTAPAATAFLPVINSPTSPPTAAAVVTQPAGEQPQPAATLPPEPTATPWQPTSSGPPQNIIVIMADSLRADHTTPYGYERNTTPNLDRLIAQQGVRFESTSSTAPWTCPSVAAMLTGQTPGRFGTGYKRYKPSIPKNADTLSELLRQQGYYTSGFVTTYCNKSRLGFGQGFNEYDEILTDNGEDNKPKAEELNQRVMNWLENVWLPNYQNKQPLFLFLYYFDPHDPYDPLVPYNTLYDPNYSGPLTPALFGVGHTAITGELQLNPADVNHLVSLYDGEITYWDDQLAIMLDYLEQKGLMENTLLVVTADHGEHFGEKNAWVHGYTLYNELLRVPLLMRYTGAIQPGLVINDPVQNYDLVPTILDWAGVQIPAEIQASSLRGLSTGQQANPARPVFSEVDALTDPNHVLYLVAPRTPIYAVEQEGWKLIHHPTQPALDELYQLEPGQAFEGENVITQYPDQAARLLVLLQAWYNIP